MQFVVNIQWSCIYTQKYRGMFIECDGYFASMKLKNLKIMLDIWIGLCYNNQAVGKTDEVGVEYAEGTPVPIPNTEVKLGGAENTWVVTPREDREMPTRWEQMFTSALLFFYTAQEKVKLKIENGKLNLQPANNKYVCWLWMFCYIVYKRKLLIQTVQKVKFI